MTRHGFLLLLILAIPRLAPADVTLFDGTLGTNPNAQNWLYLTNPLFGASATQTASPTGTTLDSTFVQSEQAGYFAHLSNFSHPLLPTLDRTNGYSVSFDVGVLSESHASNDRAGFSVIVLSADLVGIELGFWADRIWAQSDSPLFTHAEEVLTDTSALSRYTLSVVGSSYMLSRDGQSLLSGGLRNYSTFGTPYTTPNFLFLGDDTSSASAKVKLARVGVSVASVPEPGTWRLFACGIGSVVAMTRLRRGRLNPS